VRPLIRTSELVPHPRADKQDELVDREDERFQLAAARWHARFVLDAGLPLCEAEEVMTLLCRPRGANRLVVVRRLLAMVERTGLTTREIRSGA
jgi:hypothetical protein